MEADAPGTACLVGEKYRSRESESGREGGEAPGEMAFGPPALNCPGLQGQPSRGSMQAADARGDRNMEDSPETLGYKGDGEVGQWLEEHVAARFQNSLKK